jgi:hypothetical protein
MIFAALLLFRVAAAAGGLWLDVPFVHQEKNGCGSASVWMLLQYWKAPDTPRVEEIQRALYSKDARGIYARDMERYLQTRGFRTVAFKGEWEDLAAHVAKGRPLIVCLERNALGVPLHYVVVVGIAADEQLVWMNDPAERKLLPVRRSEFEKQWSATGNWTLLALPEDESVEPDASNPPQPAAELDAPDLTSASAAFRANDFTQAEQQLRAARRADPSNTFVNDFLGTTYLLDGNFDAALKYWNQAGKPKLRDIKVDPALDFDPVLLDRTFAFSRADVLTLDGYYETRRRLDALQVFPHYEFELTPTDAEDFDLTVHASEKSGPQFLSWIRGLPYQTAYPGWWNAGQRAINVESIVRWNPELRRAFVSVSSPVGLNARTGFRIQADGREEHWLRDGESFVLRRKELSGEIHGSMAGGWGWTTGAAVTERAFTNGFAGGTSLSYKASVQRSIFRMPERRLTLDSLAGVQLGRLFGPSPQHFAKVEGDLALRWFPSPRRKDDYETIVRLRLGQSTGQLPFDELFVVGLDRDSSLRLRGHSALQSGEKGAAPMGTGYALLNSDFHKRVFGNPLFHLDAGPLLDAARVSSQGEWLVDAGIQLRVSVLKSFTLNLSLARDLRAGHHALFIE